MFIRDEDCLALLVFVRGANEYPREGLYKRRFAIFIRVGTLCGLE